jgi:DNA-binding MarR family transcriptional regulator
VSRSGADLAVLLLAGYRSMVDAVVAGLAEQGHPDFRPALELAMRAVSAGADSASDVGRRTGVSKQAAAKTIATLTERGYVTREDDPADGRRKRLVVTPLGHEVIRLGEAQFDEVHRAWADRLGADGLAALETQLRTVVDP